MSGYGRKVEYSSTEMVGVGGRYPGMDYWEKEQWYFHSPIPSAIESLGTC